MRSFSTIRVQRRGRTDDLPKKKGGNKVVKVLTAPFKAVGRLFGRGGNDENKIERMTEKDAERFASVGVESIEDARTVKHVTSASSAREHFEAGREFLIRTPTTKRSPNSRWQFRSIRS